MDKYRPERAEHELMRLRDYFILIAIKLSKKFPKKETFVFIILLTFRR